MADVVRQLMLAYNSQQGALKERSREAIGKLWELTVSDPSDATASLWVEKAAGIDRRFRLTAADMAQAYVANVERLMTGEAFSGKRVDPQLIADAVRNGVSPDEVWMRPMIRLRSLLGTSTLSKALAQARTYAADIGAMNTSLAEREGSHAAMASSPRIVGYRRVTDGNACGYCLLASTQRYHLGALLPLHGSTCGCTTAPIIGTADPGRVVDSQLLDRLKTRGLEDVSDPDEEYHRQVTVNEHGELGPTLTPKGQAFTGPRDIPRKARPDPAMVRAADQLRAGRPDRAEALRAAEGKLAALQQRNRLAG